MNLYLHNFTDGRNRDSFRVLLNNILDFNAKNVYFNYNQPDVSDYLLIGTQDLIYKKESLDNSIKLGVSKVQEIHSYNPNAKIILLDSTDSTCIAQTYPILEICLQKNLPIKWLLKNQLLDSPELYKNKYPLGKWWFIPINSDDILWSTDIDLDIYNKFVNLTGWNIGNYTNSYCNFYPKFQTIPDTDVCAIYQHTHDENFDHEVCSSIYYNNHRQTPYSLLEKVPRLKTVSGKLPFNDFVTALVSSKLCISPFGMGEICYRDFEAMQYGCILVKPSMELVKTIPNIYVPGITYYQVDPNWSNLVDVIDYITNHYESTIWTIQNIRKMYLDLYNPNNIVSYWIDTIL